jgi:hypothetical protein
MQKLGYTYTRKHTVALHGLAMTVSLDYRPTPKALEILEALRDAHEWIGRSALASRLDKSALNKWDIVLLGKLADAGLIETRQIPHHGPIGYEWQYRAVSIDQS